MKIRNVLMCIAVLCLCGINASLSSAKTTYHVSTSGSDQNKGTTKSPFRTINKGVAKLAPGDTLIIHGGTYTERVKISSKISGTKNKYITIKNASGERPVISGKGMKSPTLLTLDGTSYIQVSGLELAYANGQDACAVLINAGTHHFQVKNNFIHHINVPKPKVKDHCANCILVFGDHKSKSIKKGQISNNKIYDCETGWSECVSVTGNVTKVDVTNNTIRHTGNIGIDYSGNYGYCKKASRDFPRDCLIEGNTVKDCVSKYATSYGIYVDGGQRITIKNNTVSNCSGGIEVGAEVKPKSIKYATKYIKVIKNRLINNIENGITIGGYEKQLGWVKNVSIINNRCVSQRAGSVLLTLSKCSQVLLEQNQFIMKKKNIIMIYNDFKSMYTKKITFKRNAFINQIPKAKSLFVWHGETYTSFQKIKL